MPTAVYILAVVIVAIIVAIIIYSNSSTTSGSNNNNNNNNNNCICPECPTGQSCICPDAPICEQCTNSTCPVCPVCPIPGPPVPPGPPGPTGPTLPVPSTIPAPNYNLDTPGEYFISRATGAISLNCPTNNSINTIYAQCGSSYSGDFQDVTSAVAGIVDGQTTYANTSTNNIFGCPVDTSVAMMAYSCLPTVNNVNYYYYDIGNQYFQIYASLNSILTYFADISYNLSQLAAMQFITCSKTMYTAAVNSVNNVVSYITNTMSLYNSEVTFIDATGAGMSLFAYVLTKGYIPATNDLCALQSILSNFQQTLATNKSSAYSATVMTYLQCAITNGSGIPDIKIYAGNIANDFANIQTCLNSIKTNIANIITIFAALNITTCGSQ